MRYQTVVVGIYLWWYFHGVQVGRLAVKPPFMYIPVVKLSLLE